MIRFFLFLACICSLIATAYCLSMFWNGYDVVWAARGILSLALLVVSSALFINSDDDPEPA